MAREWITGQFEGDYEGRRTPDGHLVPAKRRSDIRLFDVTLLRGTLKDIRRVAGPPPGVDGPCVSQEVVEEVYIASGGVDASGRPEWIACQVFDVTLVDFEVVARDGDNAQALGQIKGALWATVDVEDQVGAPSADSGITTGGEGGLRARDLGGVDFPSALPRGGGGFGCLLLALPVAVLLFGPRIFAAPLTLLGVLAFLTGAVFVLYLMRRPVNPLTPLARFLLGAFWLVGAGLWLVAGPPALGMCSALTIAAMPLAVLSIGRGMNRPAPGMVLAMLLLGAALLPLARCHGFPAGSTTGDAVATAPASSIGESEDDNDAVVPLDVALADPDQFFQKCSRRVTLAADLLFAFDESELKPQATRELSRLVVLLRHSPKAHLVLEGHTDTIGDSEYNTWLSKQRADAVKRWLVESGKVSPKLIQTEGYGSSRPVIFEGTAASQQGNRRVNVAVICPDDWHQENAPPVPGPPLSGSPL